MSKNLKINGLTREEFQGVYDRVLKRGLSNGACNLAARNVCIEAAVCIATGDTDIKQFELLIKGDQDDEAAFSDEPKCVNAVLRDLKITLNDLEVYKNSAERAEMLYDIGIAQLGTKGKGFGNRFLKALRGLCTTLNEALLAVTKAKFVKEGKLKTTYTLEELTDGSVDIDELRSDLGDLSDSVEQTKLSVGSSYDFEGLVNTIREIDNEAPKSQRNQLLKRFIAGVIEVLRDLKSPGVVWLDAIHAERAKGAKRVAKTSKATKKAKKR